MTYIIPLIRRWRTEITRVGVSVLTLAHGNAEICQAPLIPFCVSMIRVQLSVRSNAGRPLCGRSLCKILLKFWLILPEVTAIGVRLSHASREGSALGILLSNTWITCPKVEHNPGKLGIILHRLPRLECAVTESSGALGWICGRLGCCWGNGPTSP
jgi:hypothetical protein